MSGGSYNYLFLQDYPEICEKQADLADMRDRLIALGYEDAAKETESILLLMESFRIRLDTRLDRLKPIWEAVEWADSGDSGLEDVQKAIDEYRES